MRIVSLLPSATEIVASLGLVDKLVGRSHECDYPPGVSQLPVLTAPKINPQANSLQIDQDVRSIVEKGLSVYDVNSDLLRKLAPDVIVTQSQCELCAVSESDVIAAVADWTGQRPTVLSLEPMTLNDIFVDITRTAEVLNIANIGTQLVRHLNNGFAKLAQQTATQKMQSVFFMEWIEPLMGAGNWIPEIWLASGGKIVLGADGRHSPTCTWLDLQNSNPQFIIVGPCGFGIDRARTEFTSAIARQARWFALDAVKNSNVFIVDGNQYYNRPGPRVLDAAQIAAEILHPDIISPKFEQSGWQRWCWH